MLAVGSLAALFRHWPRHAPREIGAPTPRLQRSEAASWRDRATFALILLASAYAASAWRWPRPEDAEFLAAAPLGVTYGIGLSCTLLATARIEAAYRGLDLRQRENLQPFAVAALGVAFLALLGVEFRLVGPVLFIGTIAAAAILIANPSVSLIPPKLAAWLPKAPPRATPARSSR